MTMGDSAMTLAGLGVLAQISVPQEPGLVAGVMKLGTTGILLYAIWALWKRIEKQEKADREEREKHREAEERRHREDEERNRLLLDVLIKINNREDREKE